MFFKILLNIIAIMIVSSITLMIHCILIVSKESDEKIEMQNKDK
mgnify:CR=1 FL=1